VSQKTRPLIYFQITRTILV